MIHEDLLQQALQLATIDPNRPKQVNLRRSISASYYAVFHAFTYTAASILYGKGRSQIDLEGRSLLRRAVSHNDLELAVKSLFSGALPRFYKGKIGPRPSTLVDLGRKYSPLKEARHEADYNMSVTFTRVEALATHADAVRLVSLLQSKDFTEQTDLKTVAVILLNHGAYKRR